LSDRRSLSADLAVIGAGVIGLACAWRAAQRGLRVVVLERDRPGAGSSGVAAGMLAPVSEALLTEQPLLRLGLASAASYPSFVAEVEESAGVSTGYVRCGTLLAARDADDAEALGRELALRTRLGLAVERLRASEARQLEPALAPALRLALHIPDDHAIDPRRLLHALSIALGHAGGELRTGAAAQEIVLAGDRVAGVRLADGQTVSAEHVLISSGPWTIAGLPEAARVPLRPVKGQILRLHDPADPRTGGVANGDAGSPGLIEHVLRFRGGYVVPRGDGRYVLGATMEERGFETHVTAGAVYELLRDACELLPGVGELVLDEVSAGLRPATPDNAPVIGPGVLPGLHWAVGHYRHGVLLAPVTADAVAAQLAGEEPAEHAAVFGAERFAGLAVGA